MNFNRSSRLADLKAKIAPYILYPALTGVLTGVLIFLFKVAAAAVMRLSARIYTLVRSEPRYLPLLILGAAVIGGIAAVILRLAKECRGGGIPTAVASIRGLIPLKWVQGVFVLFGSALLTYLVGVPLGNEGPSVQMGAAVGKASAGLTGKRKRALDRYLMTGGACAGFAIATGAPLSGIMFALEEAHRRFSTTLFTMASVAVLAGTVTQRYLAFFFDTDITIFDLSISVILPMRYLWAAILIGAACGGCSLLFTAVYRAVKRLSRLRFGKIPFIAKIMLIFVATALLGLASTHFIGTGHALIEALLHGKTAWYMLLLAFLVRALLMIVANSEGVSGGIFVPTLAFGALIASLLADALIALGLIDGQYYTILVVVGMASFLSSSSRTPITAITFAAEALCVASNILPVIFGVAVSYTIMVFSGKPSFADTVIEARAEAAVRGKTPIIVDTHLTVGEGSFADGMELRDILWPPTCTVLSIDRNLPGAQRQSVQELRRGDVLHLHYQTYDPEQTMQTLTGILGDQPDLPHIQSHLGSDEHVVPSD